MLRFFLILIALTLIVVLRLVLVRSRYQPVKASAEQKPKVIEMPASKPLVIKHYFFANFDHRTGPPDVSNFFENLVVHVGPEDAPHYRVYSVWVATPGALKLQNEAYRFGRGLLIVERYDMELILRAVREHIRELGMLAVEVE
jgi:hypothetical protein